MKNKLLPIYLYTAFTIITLCLILVGFWIWYPYQTIQFNGDYKFSQSSYKQGETTTYRVSYCKFTNAPVNIQKQFIDGLVFTLDNPKAILSSGCKTINVPITIPDTLPTGKYRLRNTIVYHVNPIRDITIVHYSNWFNVKE